MISEVTTTYKETRNGIDASFSHVFAQGETMAKKVGSQISMPRIVSRQTHRSNAEATCPLEYFKRNVAIPFLDHIIMCIEQQFSESAMIATSLLGLVPSIMCSKEVNIQTAVVTYAADLPSPELLHLEMDRWKERYITMSPDERPSSPAEAIKECDHDCLHYSSSIL